MNQAAMRTRVASSSAIDAAVDAFNQQTAEDRLLEFVEEQINKMKKYANISNSSGMPGFYELNKALLDYTTINASLISLDVFAKQEAYAAEEAFKSWQAEKYIEARNTLNPPTLTASKWYSGTELEAYIRSHYKEEYQKLHKEMTMAQMKVATIRRLLDAWATQSLILNRLCKNVETEALNLNTGTN